MTANICARSAFSRRRIRMCSIPPRQPAVSKVSMRFTAPLILACSVLLAGCAAAPAAPAPQGEDARFQAHAARVLEEMWREFPEFAMRVGHYKYADQVTVPDAARRARTLAFYERHSAAL